jgi:hypothetical protein
MRDEIKEASEQQSSRPAGQQVETTELEDAQGAFSLSPAPTNVSFR